MKRQKLAFEGLVELAAYNRSEHARLHAAILAESGRRLAGIAPSTVFNVNRELYSSNSALVLALADLLLDPARADDFASLPGIG